MNISKEQYEKMQKNLFDARLVILILAFVILIFLALDVGRMVGSAIQIEKNEQMIKTALPEKVHIDNFVYIDKEEAFQLQNLTIDWGTKCQ